MPGMPGTHQRPASLAEVWAARAWNVFNEGRPFSVVYPLLVLVAAAVVGLAPDGSLWLALVAAASAALVLSRFPFALRGRALLWLAALAAVPLLEPWRAPALLAGALAGYAFFTVVVWGSVYYHLRTGAPWTNGLRFWRLVLTNSDPTSGNALEQVPKLLIALSAATLLAEEPTGGSVARVLAALRSPRRVARSRRAPSASACRAIPRVYRRADASEEREALARRVYVIVVDGCNRGRLWQANAPVMDRLAREGTEYLAVEPAYPARTVVCFSSMLTGAEPAEHGMRSNFAPRLGVRVESVFDVLERAAAAAGSSGSPTCSTRSARTWSAPSPRCSRPRRSTARSPRRRAGWSRRRTRTCSSSSCSPPTSSATCAACAAREYLDQLAETDRHVGDFLAFLDERGKLDGATVILMADHGQGRGIGGHGHLDWGERPVPFVVWGEGAVPGAVSREPRSVLELAATVSRLLGVRAPSAARGRPLVPVEDPGVDGGAGERRR